MCGPRGGSPGLGTAISAMRNVSFEPIAPDTGSSEVRPGRPSFFASDCLSSRAISPTCRNCLISRVPPCTASSWR